MQQESAQYKYRKQRGDKHMIARKSESPFENIADDFPQ